MIKPHRGEVWWVDLDPTVGRETKKVRPALIVSVDAFNHGAAELVWIVPITSTVRTLRSWVQISPPAGGLETPGCIKCEEVRSVSKLRLKNLIGTVDNKTMSEVEYAIAKILGID